MSTALKTAITSVTCLAPLLAGKIKVSGVDIEDVEAKNPVPTFRAMTREHAYDVSEMAVVTYLMMRDYGLPFTAIPVFPAARFVHAGIVVNEAAGIAKASDLEGKTVGCATYAMTPAVWMRRILIKEGMDSSRVTWLPVGDEHVEEYHRDEAPNVMRREGVNLNEVLASGEIAAALGGNPATPGVRPYFNDAEAAAREAFADDGVLPLIHLIVVRDEVLADHPGLAQALFEACREAKHEWEAVNGPKPFESDPMPLGLASTRGSLEALIETCLEQRVIRRPLDIDEIFPGGLGV